ncbi:hypothetical protein BH09SUM1_BH09SUM1_12600 [soil metagenome]
MQPLTPDISGFPLWIELSGLPLKLAVDAKSPLPWLLFRKIVEFDMAFNPAAPGIVEASPSLLAERTGIPVDKIEKNVKALRKSGIIRAFLPDNAEEPGLFQVIAPLAAGKSPDQVRAENPAYFLEGEWPPRYAIAVAESDESPRNARAAKIKRVVELYLNVFSMKINSIILDQLQIISDRYDMDLIEKVFERAKKKETVSLSWILTDIRREQSFRAASTQLST